MLHFMETEAGFSEFPESQFIFATWVLLFTISTEEVNDVVMFVHSVLFIQKLESSDDKQSSRFWGTASAMWRRLSGTTSSREHLSTKNHTNGVWSMMCDYYIH